MVDWVAHYDAIYAALGVSGVLNIGHAVELTVIDKTAGIAVGEGTGNRVEVSTIRPGACVRRAELTAKGVTNNDLDGATLTMNGKSWEVKAHQARPAPTGEAGGEELLILIEA